MERFVRILCKFLSVLFIMVLLYYRHVLPIIFHYNYLLSGFTFSIVKPILFLLFNLAAAIGLFNVRPYGFISAYISLIYTTFLYGFAYLPFLLRWLPYGDKHYTMIAINILIAILVFFSHVIIGRDRTRLN